MLLLDAGRTTQALQIAEAASRQHPECLELWQVRLSSSIATNKQKKEWMESALKTAPDEVSYCITQRPRVVVPEQRKVIYPFIL